MAHHFEDITYVSLEVATARLAAEFCCEFTFTIEFILCKTICYFKIERKFYVLMAEREASYKIKMKPQRKFDSILSSRLRSR